MFLAGGRRLPSLNFRDGDQGENFWSISEKRREKTGNTNKIHASWRGDCSEQRSGVTVVSNPNIHKLKMLLWLTLKLQART